MATNFPISLDNLTNPTPTDDVSLVIHSAQHINSNDAIESIQAKLWITWSLVTSSVEYKINAIENLNYITNIATGFNRRNSNTIWVIELSPDGTTIYGINSDWTTYTNISWNFANGTAFQTLATARTLAIFPESWQTSFDVYVLWVRYNKTDLETLVFTNTSWRKVASYNSSWVLTEYLTITYEIFTGTAFVSVVYWNAVTQELVLFWDERHGIEMDGSTHYYEHFSEGARYISWLWLNWLSVGSWVYTSISSGVIFDEDIINNIPTQTNSPFRYIDGTIWRIDADGLDLASMGTTYPYYNEDTGGGIFQLTEIWNNNYCLIHFLATNDKIYPISKVLWQDEYTTINLAREGALTEVQNLIIAGLPSPEFHLIGTVIVDSDWNLVLNSEWNTFIDWREEKITWNWWTSGITTLHADLIDTTTNWHPASIISVSATPTSYTPTTSFVEGHLSGIDTELATFVDKSSSETIEWEKTFTNAMVINLDGKDSNPLTIDPSGTQRALNIVQTNLNQTSSDFVYIDIQTSGSTGTALTVKNAWSWNVLSLASTGSWRALSVYKNGDWPAIFINGAGITSAATFDIDATDYTSIPTNGAFKFSTNTKWMELLVYSTTDDGWALYFDVDRPNLILKRNSTSRGANMQIWNQNWTSWFYSSWWTELQIKARLTTSCDTDVGAFGTNTALNGDSYMKIWAYYIWVDATGDLRIKSTAPTTDTDGTIVGTQS